MNTNSFYSGLLLAVVGFGLILSGGIRAAPPDEGVIAPIIGASDFDLAKIANPAEGYRDLAFAKKQAGKVLLSTGGKGQAYFVNPKDLKKYYLEPGKGNWRIFSKQKTAVIGDELFPVIGVSAADLNKIANPAEGYRDLVFAKKQAGKILIRNRGQGEAYYINPADFKKYYLGPQDDDWRVVRRGQTGVINRDIKKITADGQGKISEKRGAATDATVNQPRQIQSPAPAPNNGGTVVVGPPPAANSSNPPARPYILVLGGGSYVSHPTDSSLPPAASLAAAPANNNNNAPPAGENNDNSAVSETPPPPAPLSPPAPPPPAPPAPPPLPALIAPSSGEKVFIGKTFEVKWNALAVPGSPVLVTITLQRPDGSESIIAKDIPNFGSYQWPVPADEKPGANASLRVWHNLFYMVSGYRLDSNPFILALPIITVLAPNGGEKYRIDDVVPIRWVTEGLADGATLVVTLPTDAADFGPTLFSNIANTGGVYWAVPRSIIPGQYRIGIHCYTPNATCLARPDFSDAPFTIQIGF